MAHQAEARHSNGHGNTNGHGPPCPYLRKPACGLTRIEPRWLIRQMTARQSARQHPRARHAVPLPLQTCCGLTRIEPRWFTGQMTARHANGHGSPCPYLRKPACGPTRIEPRWFIRQKHGTSTGTDRQRARLAVPLPPQTCLQPDTDQIPMAHQADDGTPCPYFPAEE